MQAREGKEGTSGIVAFLDSSGNYYASDVGPMRKALSQLVDILITERRGPLVQTDRIGPVRSGVCVDGFKDTDDRRKSEDSS